jgi:hypothetical protein
MLRFAYFKFHITLKTFFLFIAFHSGYAQNPFTEIHNLQCRDTLLISGLGFPTWATAEIVSPPKYGYAKIEPNTGLQSLL